MKPFVIALFLALVAPLYSESVVPPNEIEKIRVLSERVLSTCRANTDGQQRARLDNVTVEITKNDSARLLAAAFKGGNTIILSTGLIAGLNVYSQSMALGSKYNIPFLESRYILYRQRTVMYKNRNIQSLEEYTGLTPMQITEWKSDDRLQELSQTLWYNAIAFIVAHEAGHHATNSFYNANATPQEIYQMELNAESWAINCLIRSGLAPIAGSLVANSYFHDQFQMENLFGRTSSHPSALNRSLFVIDESISSGQEIPEIRDGAAAITILRNFAAKKFSDYKERGADYYASIADTEKHSLSAFIAARMFEAKGPGENIEKAYVYYAKAYALGYEPAILWLANCVEAGKGTEKDIVKATRLYQIASEAGLMLGEYNYLRLKKASGGK